MKTTFKNYLSEAAEGVTYLFKREIVDFIKHNCVQALHAAPLWRGMQYHVVDDQSFIIADPSQRGERKSLTGNNVMNTLLSNDKKWNHFPRRNQSAFFTTNKKDAEKFGDVYRVFPVDNATMGVGATSDFNYTPVWHDSSIGFNTASVSSDVLGDCIIDIILGYADKPHTDVEIRKASYEQLVTWFDEVSKNIEAGKVSRLMLHEAPLHVYEKVIEGIKKKKSMNDTVMGLLDPKNAGFKVMNIKDFHVYDQAVEVWTETKYAMVHKTFVDRVLEEVRNG